MTRKIMIQRTKKSKLMKQMTKFMIMKKQMAKREKITPISMLHPLLHQDGKCASAIPDDVIIEILVKLPARSVGRFRCVCKSWLSATTNLPFIRVHTQHSRITRQSLIIHRTKPRMNYYLASPDANTDVNITLCRLPGRKHKIVGSCDGLLYLRNIDGNYIVNPLTGYFIKLPTPSDNFNVILGFYFHNSTSKYRVLQDGDNTKKGTFVCVVGEKSWRRIPCLLPVFNRHGFLDLKGSLYWLASKEPFGQPNTITTFDKESEVCGLLSLPPFEQQHNFGGNLVEVNEELGLWIMGNDHIIDVWIKEESWVKRYSVTTSGILREDLWFQSARDLPEDLWFQGAAGVIRNDELLIDLMVSMTHYHLIRCNLKSGACCYHRSKFSRHKLNFHSFPYVEALAYPDCSFI